MNTTTHQFDLLSSNKYIFSDDIWYASLSKTGKYLAIGVSQCGITYIFSDPLGSKPQLEQIVHGTFLHKFSENGKYFITSNPHQVNIYVNCNWDTDGYYLNENNHC